MKDTNVLEYTVDSAGRLIVTVYNPRTDKREHQPQMMRQQVHLEDGHLVVMHKGNVLGEVLFRKATHSQRWNVEFVPARCLNDTQRDVYSTNWKTHLNSKLAEVK